MSEHTKEPWSYELETGSFLRIYSEINPGIVDGCGCCGSPNCDDADARRIVACINACAGFDTELLENILMLGITLKRRFKTLTDSESELQKQRDELLAALTGVVEDLEMRAVDGVVPCGRSAYAKAKSALTGKPFSEYF